MKFTKFGVWDVEVKQLIKDIAVLKTQKTEDEISNWFYEQGMITFQGAQNKSFQETIAASLRQSGKRPIITGDYMKDAKVKGFNAILPSLQGFATDDACKQGIEECFSTFVATTVPKYQKFYAFQANITNIYLQAMDDFDSKKALGQNLTPIIPMKLINDLFEKFIAEHSSADDAELVAQVQDQMLLMKEFAAYMAEKAEADKAAKAAEAEKAAAATTTTDEPAIVSPKPISATASIAFSRTRPYVVTPIPNSHVETSSTNNSARVDAELEERLGRLKMGNNS